ncbi:hypothetical protein QQP08_011761 [Theobroma cacao]|nr:hypothetical protein QQP08_011761 [Theobroma cacao]
MDATDMSSRTQNDNHVEFKVPGAQDNVRNLHRHRAHVNEDNNISLSSYPLGCFCHVLAHCSETANPNSPANLPIRGNAQNYPGKKERLQNLGAWL